MKVICSAEFQNIASTRRIPQRIKAQILRVHEATYKVFFLSETPHFTPRYWEHLWNVCTTTVTLLGVPSPFGHKLLTIWVVRPLHETALLKGFKYESVNVPLMFSGQSGTSVARFLLVFLTALPYILNFQTIKNEPLSFFLANTPNPLIFEPTGENRICLSERQRPRREDVKGIHILISVRQTAVS